MGYHNINKIYTLKYTVYMVIVCCVVRSSECRETVGRTVTGKSHVIVSTNELFRVCIVVAVVIELLGAESSLSLWAWLFDLLMINWKCTCHLRETVERERMHTTYILARLTRHALYIVPCGGNSFWLKLKKFGLIN